jgi:hypothetical protein
MNSITNPERKCLSRTDWILCLLKTFQQSSNSTNQVSIDHFQKSLSRSIESEEIHLTDLENYSKPEQYLTFSKVSEKLSLIQGFVYWEQILNSLLSKLYEIPKKNSTPAYPQISPDTYCNTLDEYLIDLNPSIVYLNLSSSALEFLPKYPQTIRILNVSNNALTQLTIEPGIEYLNANQNLIPSVEIPKTSKAEELYLKDNKLSNLNFFSRMQNLRILDVSQNQLDNCEDLSYIILNRNLKIFSYKENPVIEENENFFERILSHLKLNPDNCFEFSKCPNMNVLLGHGVNTHKRNFTLPLDFNRMPSARQPCKAQYVTPTGFSGSSSPTGYTSINKSVSYHFSPLSKENIERKMNRSVQRRSNSTLITPQNIVRAASIKYGNPIAALMIRPNSKRRLQRKKK